MQGLAGQSGGSPGTSPRPPARLDTEPGATLKSRKFSVTSDYQMGCKSGSIRQHAVWPPPMAKVP